MYGFEHLVNANAPPLLSASFSMDQLSGLESMPGSIDNIRAFENSGTLLLDGDLVSGSQNICVNHRGVPNTFHFVFGFIGMSLVLAFFLLGPQILLVRLILNRLRRKR